jgi:alpha-L-fucosidase 2
MHALNRTNRLTFSISIIVLIALASLTVWLSTKNYESNKIQVACVGDSITEGSRYTSDLKSLLGVNYSVGNFGVGLATVNSESSKTYINQPVFEAAKASQPQIVIILLGTNDANPAYQQYIDNFTRDYKALISAFEALGSKPKIYMVLPPPIFSDSLGPYNSILVQNVIPKIRQVANETGLPLIDLYSAMVGHPEYFEDGVHPNVEGSKTIAAIIYEAIK